MAQTNYGPRHSGGHRPGNVAALDAADQAINGASPRVTQSMLMSRIRPDAEQPRDYFPPDAIESRKESILKDGQLDPFKVRPLWPDEMAARTPDEVRNGVDHQLIDGEIRYWAIKDLGWERADVEVKNVTNREKVLDIQNAQNIEHEFMSLSAICRSIARYIDEFGRSQKFLADNQFKKFAKGNAAWVGDRYRVWKKIKDDPELVELFQLFNDVLTHVEIIQGVASKAVRKEMIQAVKSGASVGAIKMLLPRPAAQPEPEPTPPPEEPRRSFEPSTPPSIDDLLESTERELEADRRDKEELEKLQWDFPEEPTYDAQSMTHSLDTIERLIGITENQVPYILEHRHTNPLVKEAFVTRIGRIEARLAEIKARFTTESASPAK